MAHGTAAETDWITVAKELQPALEAEAAASEALGTASPAAVEALRRSGILGLIVPTELGGGGASIGVWTDAMAALAYADGSLAWTANANITITAFAAYYTGDAAVKQIFAGGLTEAAAGFARPGIARPDRTGWRIGGKYNFGSAAEHSAWIGASGIEQDSSGAPVITDGAPRVRACFVPREKIVWHGNWDVMGLRATGSWDYELPEQLVDHEFTWLFLAPETKRGPARARLAVPVLGIVGHAGWGLGMAQRAIDEALKLHERTLSRGGLPIGERPDFLADMGTLSAAVRSARAYALETFAAAEEFIEHADAPTPQIISDCQEATTLCTRVGVQAARVAFEWCGPHAIRYGTMERLFRDMHVGAQHLSQTNDVFVRSGTMLLPGG